jgi:hypothetical protein
MTKYDHSKPKPRITPEQAKSLALEAVYRNFTLSDLAKHLGCNAFDLPQLVKHYEIPLRRNNRHRFYDPAWEPDDSMSPTRKALAALAQYKLGFLPPEEPNCVRFRDGNPDNLRPENLVYTGTYRMRKHQKYEATFNDLPLEPYLAKCARCGYRTSESREPEGWKRMSFLEYGSAKYSPKETQVGEGLLCPICQEFTDVLWNGSRG